MPRTRKRYVSPVDEKTIGRRLRELRELRGLTQVEVAEQLNIKQTLVSAYERGAVRMHGALVAGFAKLFDASADEILCLEKPKTGPPIGDRRTMRLLQEINGLPRRERDTLVKTINNYLKGSRVA
jgi:transcriptional regulator with XRE-family HTH domain